LLAPDCVHLYDEVNDWVWLPREEAQPFRFRFKSRR